MPLEFTSRDKEKHCSCVRERLGFSKYCPPELIPKEVD